MIVRGIPRESRSVPDSPAMKAPARKPGLSALCKTFCPKPERPAGSRTPQRRPTARYSSPSVSKSLTTLPRLSDKLWHHLRPQRPKALGQEPQYDLDYVWANGT
jgi:hypothetical protein